MSALPRTRVDSQAALSLAQGDYHDAEGHVMLTEDGIPVYRRTAHGRALAITGEAPTGAGAALETDKTEWLLTGGDGSFAMGTVAGVMNRRYHGLLIASMQPPVRRMMALSAVAESLVLDADTGLEQRFDLACFRFRPSELHPRGDQHLVGFEKDVACRWTYRAGPVEVLKELILTRETTRSGSGALIRYTARVVPGARPVRSVRLVLRPLVAMRDFHGLILRETARDRYRINCESHAITVGVPEGRLRLVVSEGKTFDVQQWWYNFQYEQEHARGYDYLEDLLHPGSFSTDWAWPQAGGKEDGLIGSVTLSAAVNGEVDPNSFDAVEKAARKRMEALVRPMIAKTGPQDRDAAASLAAAADDFIARRVPAPGAVRSADSDAAADQVTILAGYPWFADWGRDAMISLPGLLLSTGRLDEARRILQTFAHHRGPEGSDYYGLVPNVFDDYTGRPHYNTVDASLWFVHAVCQYLEKSGDTATFHRELLPACIDVVTAYSKGTAFGIRMDEADGLIIAGDEGTQLTWMDAKRDGVVFTPRHGKAVEINALWYNALRAIAAASGTHRPGLRTQMNAMADKTAAGFVRSFVHPTTGGLADVLTPDGHGGWRADWRVRPNQIFAASLAYSPLSAEQRRSVTELVKTHLLTPCGLATLDPRDPGFKGRYRGRMFDRDAAYHNGTAWPWLLGPLAEAVLRCGDFSPAAKAEARGVLSGLLGDLDRECVGQLPEVFDGESTAEHPQEAAGCPAQAWSVAETLRVLMLLQG